MKWRTYLILCHQAYIKYWVVSQWDFPGGSEVKASAWNSGDPGSIPGLGRSPGEGNSRLKNIKINLLFCIEFKVYREILIKNLIKHSILGLNVYIIKRQRKVT